MTADEIGNNTEFHDLGARPLSERPGTRDLDTKTFDFLLQTTYCLYIMILLNEV